MEIPWEIRLWHFSSGLVEGAGFREIGEKQTQRNQHSICGWLPRRASQSRNSFGISSLRRCFRVGGVRSLSVGCLSFLSKDCLGRSVGPVVPAPTLSRVNLSKGATSKLDSECFRTFRRIPL